MLVYNYTYDTFVYTSTTEADESPLEPGVYLVPANATTTPIPEIPAGKRAVWVSDAWMLQNIPVVPPEPVVPPVPPAHTPAEYRAAAYKAESDPLFFQWQRGTSTEEVWLAKVAEIKAKYPD